MARDGQALRCAARSSEGRLKSAVVTLVAALVMSCAGSPRREPAPVANVAPSEPPAVEPPPPPDGALPPSPTLEVARTRLEALDHELAVQEEDLRRAVSEVADAATQEESARAGEHLRRAKMFHETVKQRRASTQREINRFEGRPSECGIDPFAQGC